MNSENIYLLLTDFSEILNVTPPTGNLIEWWIKSLEEMSNFDLLELLEFGFLIKCSEPGLKKMHQLLIEQIEKRRLLNTLA